MDFGIEHLKAWQVLALKARLLIPFPHLTLIRASLEGSVKSRWLLEPGISRDERRGRGMGAQIADYDERRKFEDDAGARLVAPAKPAAQRIEDIKREAARSGVPVRSVPKRTELFRRYIFPQTSANVKGDAGASLYRILSAPAHGMQWAIHLSPPPELIRQAGGYFAKLEFNEDLATMATEVAVFASNAALRELEAYTRTQAR